MKLRIELVPETSWGQNLRKRIGVYRWRKLREQILAAQGNVCANCGASKRLQCHEVWDFNARKKTQTLRGFRISCTACHLASHFGVAQILAAEGQIDIQNIIAHFLKVNKVTMKQFEQHKTEAFALWRKRSMHDWKVDLGRWANLVRGVSPTRR